MSTRHLFLGFLGYFSLARISSALMPPASNFFRTDSASAFFASSAALASSFAFFASRDATSFSAFFRAVFFSFKSAFKVSMFAVMDAISDASASFADYFSAICVAKSAVTVLSLFLLPFVLGMVITSFLLLLFKYNTVWI